ncbi:MAG: PD-(D/E)XK nuclease family protein [Acidobacteriota bacterium]
MNTDKGFLEKIAGSYFDKYGKEIRNIAFVFPNRRSSVYFKNNLTMLSPVPLWSPAIFSINDLVRECSGLEIPESYELIFELYYVYRDVFPAKNISMENFFQTGKTIISDLNEIDKGLADIKKLFTSLRDLHGLEDPEPFDNPEIKKDYREFWIELEDIYHPFRRSLESHHTGYEGMAFRKVAENIELITEKGWKKIVFAGFNALSGAERSILLQLKEMGKVDIFFEGDKYFTEDTEQEAGTFFRKNKNLIGQKDLILPPDKGLSGEKRIEIIETTSDVGQVKYCGIKLTELLNNSEKPENIAIVLPDENLLFPVLNSLPENMEKGNISLGYPLRQTSVYSLYESLMELHNRKSTLFSRKALIRVLGHPYITMIADKNTHSFLNELRKGTGTFIEVPGNSGEVLEKVISENNNSIEFLDKLLSVLEKIRESVAKDNIRLSEIEREFIYRFHTLSGKLNEVIKRTGDPVSLKGFHRMFNDLIGSVHIPFTGEPLEGMQILGVLEMQNLRFKNLFLLSMNEDSFPSGKHSSTFIPQDIRNAFDLPLHGEREAIFAYHFYRMIANSKNITLIYSGVKPGIMAGERSRFIDQLLLEYGEYNPSAKITHITADFKLDINYPEKITINKNESSMEKIRKLSFSPTSLRTWKECRLRFWLRYILGLKDDQDTDDATNPAKFGSIAHKVLEKIYQGASGKEVGKSYYSRFTPDLIEEMIRSSFEDEKVKEIETGMNRITFEVIKKLTEQFLNDEVEMAPVSINSLEEKLKDVEFTFEFKGDPETAKLNGTIDRIDNRDGITRIIDYKTGNFNKLNIRGDLKDTDFVKNKEIFQLLFYAWLLKEKLLTGNKFKLGIYPFKKFSDKLSFVKVEDEELLTSEILEKFEDVLSSILSEIYDPEIPFTQTGDEKNCRYCLHKNICERNTGNNH